MEEETSGSQQISSARLESEDINKMAEVESFQHFVEEPSTPDDYQDSEYGDDPWDPEEPEFLWNKYLKGVKLHQVPSVPNRANVKKSKTNCSKKAGETSDPKMTAVTELEDEATKEQHGQGSATTSTEPSKSNDGINNIRSASPPQQTANHQLCWKKKQRMRTSREVIDRITWDPDLPAENFNIGYLDRFVGLVEKPFLFFDWTEDISAVDYDVLAVPQHRIVYFKYRDHKVWDKYERLDLIFGSTESSKEEDIRELIARVDEEHSQLPADATIGLFYDSDDDDGIRVCIDQVDDAKMIELARKISPARPNYFVAIRVTDPQIQEQVLQVKRHLLLKEPRLRDFLMPDGALHVTLAMLKLDGPAEIDKAVKALEQCRHSLASYFAAPLAVKLDGLNTFNSYVLYAKVHAPESFFDMHRDLLSLLREQGVQLAHEHDFIPHMTLLKLTKSRSRLLRCPYIDPFVYVDHKDTLFGVQPCNNLHLCVIGEEKRFDGFYQSAAEIHFEQI